MAKFHAWVRDLGDTAINPGTPLGMSKTVNADGISDVEEQIPCQNFQL